MEKKKLNIIKKKKSQKIKNSFFGKFFTIAYILRVSNYNKKKCISKLVTYFPCAQKQIK